MIVDSQLACQLSDYFSHLDVYELICCWDAAALTLVDGRPILRYWLYMHMRPFRVHRAQDCLFWSHLTFALWQASHEDRNFIVVSCSDRSMVHGVPKIQYDFRNVARY